MIKIPLLAIVLLSCKFELNEEKIIANSTFVFGDALIGQIKQATDEESIGVQVTITGLNGQSPIYIAENGFTFKMKKVFEDDDVLTLALAGPLLNGGVDTFVIDKKTGKFARVEAGRVFGVFSSASLGCFK